MRPKPPPQADPEPLRVVLYTRAGCHLCDDARVVVQRVVGQAYEEIDIDGDPRLAERYGEEVPVVAVDGRQLCYWRVPEDRLRTAVRG